MNVQHDIEEEPPLDPAAERLRRKMVRLLAVSIGIMMIGLMAVLGAVVYRIANPEGSAAATDARPAIAPEQRLSIGADSEIVSTALDGDRLLLHIRNANGERTLLVYDLSGNRVIARIAID